MSADYAASSADTTPKKRPLTDASSYDDSDLGPVHRYGPPPTARRPLENEIATVGGRSLYGPAPAYPGLLNEGYLGDVYPGQAADSFDDRSIEARFAGVVDSSAGGGAGSSRATRPARPQLAAGATADRSSGGRWRRPPGDGAARDSPRVLTDSNGTATRAFQFGQKKVSIRFDYRYRIDFFDSIRQSDKYLPLVHSNSKLGVILQYALRNCFLSMLYTV